MRSSYFLSFGKSQSWILSCVPELQEWLDFIANIMELPVHHNSIINARTIHCTKRTLPIIDNEAIGCMQVLSDGGWRIDYGTVALTFRQDGRVFAEVLHNIDYVIDIYNISYILFPIYIAIVENGGLVLHAAAAMKYGKAWLLAGSSGAGKSTCSRNLQDGWTSLCDDMCLIVFDKNQYFVYPMPTWSQIIENHKKAKSWSCSTGIPLQGIFFLKQASENRLKSVEGYAEKTIMLNKSAGEHWKNLMFAFSKSTVKTRLLNTFVFNNAQRLARIVPFYELSVSLHGQFWKYMDIATKEVSADAAVV
ncbi:MAG: SynChlorMet cassette protein ScmC [Chlorobium sp.]|nr:MAG: SynChlorMet cassette protein ScmC [Chlorobium sp.]